MRVSINQPAYIPYLGYFERIDYADVHIVLDHVQFEKNSFTNRNKIISNQGPQWLTIPVSKGKNGEVTINKVQTSNNRWIKNHLKSIFQNYSKAPYFDQYFKLFKSLLESKKDSFNFLEIIESINQKILELLEIHTQIIYSHDLNIQTKKSNLVLDICKSQNATEYISGEKGKNYLESDNFIDNNISVIYQSYNHPKYAQKDNKFTSYLSVLDLIFYKGPESLTILRKGRNYIT